MRAQGDGEGEKEERMRKEFSSSSPLRVHTHTYRREQWKRGERDSAPLLSLLFMNFFSITREICRGGLSSVPLRPCRERRRGREAAYKCYS